MLFHASMSAVDPENVANVLAKIMGGRVTKSPEDMFRACYNAFALDERGTLIEVHPETFAFVPEPGDLYDPQRRAVPTPTHFALGSPLEKEEVMAIAASQGWYHRYDLRRTPGGNYGVVEIYIENRMMIEVLTPEMQSQYLAFAARVRARLPNA